MPLRKISALDNVLGKIDDLDSSNLQTLVQRLARERKLLETVFNIIHEGILVINLKGTIEYANSAACQLIGLSSKQIGSASLWKFMPDLTRTIDISEYENEQNFFDVSREIEINYPKHRFVRLYIVAIPNQQKDEEKKFSVILSDITQEKISTQQMIENEKVSTVLLLAAGVAHELGNPINSMTIHLQLIERQLEAIEETNEHNKIKKSIKICANEISRLDNIITNFLQAIRPTLPDFQDLDLTTILKESIEFQKVEISGANITLELDIDKSLPVISADQNLIKQALFNVLKNAREAISKEGIIKIQTRSDDEFVFIEIGDSGSGIKKEHIGNIFQPYFTTKNEGHGLGMMIVNRIMHDHGGQIGISSNISHGTVFTLQFPQKHRRVRLLNS